MSNYREAFPDFDPATMPLIPAGWQDRSWRNDASPCFVTGEYTVWIDYADPAQRENGGCRFTVENGLGLDVFSTDDWSRVLAWFATSPGRVAYEADCALMPLYHDGTPRKAWDRLPGHVRDTWEREPTPRTPA